MPQETHGNREEDAMPHDPPYVCENGHSFMQTALGCVACLPQLVPDNYLFDRVSAEVSATEWTTVHFNIP